jgi:hypothetical protein
MFYSWQYIVTRPKQQHFLEKRGFASGSFRERCASQPPPHFLQAFKKCVKTLPLSTFICAGLDCKPKRTYLNGSVFSAFATPDSGFACNAKNYNSLTAFSIVLTDSSIADSMSFI